MQLKHHNGLNENLYVNELLLLIDFSENYKNKQQNEIQWGYFGQSCFSNFTAYCYLKSPEGDLLKESVTVATESTDHCRATHFSPCIYNYFIYQRKTEVTPETLNLYAWSDGCSA